MLFYLRIIFLASCSLTSLVKADSVTDAVGEMFTWGRTGLNTKASRALDGSCGQMVARAHKARCEQEGKAQDQSVDKIASSIKDINMILREQDFISKAHQEQSEAINCEIRQLRAFYNEDSVKPFYGQVMQDLCAKLPELKLRWKRLTYLQKVVTDAEEKYARNNKPSNYGITANESLNASLTKIITENKEKLVKEQNLYTTLKSSLWRSNDEEMDKYIYEAMASRSKHAEVCLGASSQYEQYGPARKNFQDRVIAKMLARAQDSLQVIGPTPEKIGVAGMQVLIKNSNWSKYLKESGEEGNLENALMMCKLDQKYVRGDKVRQNMTMVGSLFIGGAGMYLQMARFSTFFKPAAIQNILMGSRVLMMASAFPSVPLTIEQTWNACYGQLASSGYDLQGQNCPVTTTGNIDMAKMIQMETSRMESENCALNLALAGVELAPGVAGFLAKFTGKAGSKIDDLAELAAKQARANARASRHLAAEQAQDGEDIVVTASRLDVIKAKIRGLIPSKPKTSKQIDGLKQDISEMEDEIKDELRVISDDVEGQFTAFKQQGPDNFFAAHPELTQEQIAQIRLLQQRISRDTDEIARLSVTGTKSDALTQVAVNGKEFEDLTKKYPQLMVKVFGNPADQQLLAKFLREAPADEHGVLVEILNKLGKKKNLSEKDLDVWKKKISQSLDNHSCKL